MAIQPREEEMPWEKTVPLLSVATCPGRHMCCTGLFHFAWRALPAVQAAVLDAGQPAAVGLPAAEPPHQGHLLQEGCRGFCLVTGPLRLQPDLFQAHGILLFCAEVLGGLSTKCSLRMPTIDQAVWMAFSIVLATWNMLPSNEAGAGVDAQRLI